MSTIGSIILLVLGILLATVWAVNIIVQILGIIVAVAAAVVLFRVLTGNRNRTDL
jgi:hypothetical protein